MTSGSDEIEKNMNTIVTEARVTLDTRFFGKNVIVLSFEVTDNFRKAVRMTELASVDY